MAKEQEALDTPCFYNFARLSINDFQMSLLDPRPRYIFWGMVGNVLKYGEHCISAVIRHVLEPKSV